MDMIVKFDKNMVNKNLRHLTIIFSIKKKRGKRTRIFFYAVILNEKLK